MSTTIVDRRGKPTTTFGELCLGDCFQDEDGDVCIKIDSNYALYQEPSMAIWQRHFMEKNEAVLPLKGTLTVEREDNE